MRQLLAARFSPESAAARVNNKNKHCATLHESTHLQPVEVARHHARQAKRLPARRRPVVHVEAGGRGRKPMARHRRHAGHDARALRWPKRNLRVVEGWRRLAQLGAWSKGAREVEAQRVHELERGVDLAQLRSGDAHQPAEEAIVVFEVEGGGGGAALQKPARPPAWRTPCTRGTPGEARRRSPPRPQRRPNRAACRTTRACCRRSRRTSARCGLERAGGAGGRLP